MASRTTGSARKPKAGSVQEAFVATCKSGDVPAVRKAVASGASVNDLGRVGGFEASPLCVAVAAGHRDVVALLLSHGCDANNNDVMAIGAFEGSADLLRLLVDAGGDVNLCSRGWPPLFAATSENAMGDVGAKVSVLLAQPRLDLSATVDGRLPEDHTRNNLRPAVADMIAAEVDPTLCACVGALAVSCRCGSRGLTCVVTPPLCFHVV